MSKDWLKGRGQVSIPKPAKAGVNSDKGTVKGGAGQPLKMAGKGPVIYLNLLKLELTVIKELLKAEQANH